MNGLRQKWGLWLCVLWACCEGFIFLLADFLERTVMLLQGYWKMGFQYNYEVNDNIWSKPLS